VHNGVNFFRQRFNYFSFSDVALSKMEFRILSPHAQVSKRSIGKVVEDPDLCSFVEKRVYRVASYESCAPGNQHAIVSQIRASQCD
jgi:hypothetical protein